MSSCGVVARIHLFATDEDEEGPMESATAANGDESRVKQLPEK